MFGSGPSDLAERLERIERKLDALEYHSHGARAVSLGDNRVLAKAVVAGRNIAYLLEADDRLITPWLLITGDYETELTNWLVRELKPDSRCIDIGANFGRFTCLMARFTADGQVVGVEADERIWTLARDNTLINGFNHASVIHAAISDGDAPVTLYRRNTRSGNTSIIAADTLLTDLLGEAPAESFSVRGITVDEVVAGMGGRVDFMKIDVEGSEPLAFRGMTRTLADNPQLVIMMEWSPGQIKSAGFDVSVFLDELTGMGFDFFDMRGSELAPLTKDDLLAIPYLFAIALKRRHGL